MILLGFFSSILCTFLLGQILAEGNICEDGETKAHETNCNFYYECASNEFILRECPATLYFNTQLGVCDYPLSANCICLDCSTTIKSCPKENDPDVDILLPHPNCNRFYQCDWGVPYERICPAGLNFNKEDNVCSFVSDAKCVEGAAPAQPGAIPITEPSD